VEIFFGVEGSAVDALELRVLFVSQPVSAGDVEQLERLDLPGRGKVRAAAEVGELAGAVDGNLFIGLGELLDEMALHEVAFLFELLQALVAGQELARVRNVLLYKLLHLLFDLFQVLRSERSRTIEVIEKSTLGGRAMPELGLGKQLQHGGREQVGRR